MSEATQEQINSLMSRISSVESGIARMAGLEAAVVAIDDDYGEPQKRFVAEESGGPILAEYASYFKVYDASSGSVCKYGVYDGHLENESGECGEAYVNGVKIDVPVFKSAEIESAGEYKVYLRGYVASAGANAEVLSSSTPSGFAYQERLLGRVTVQYVGDKYVITNINQDYLVGGEIVFILFKECGTAW